MNSDVTVSRHNLVFLSAAVAAVLLTAALVMVWSVSSRANFLKTELLFQAGHVADMLDSTLVSSLPFQAGDRRLPQDQQVRSQLAFYAGALKTRLGGKHQYISIYIMKFRNDQFVFGPESIEPSSPFASEPGAVYQKPPSALRSALAGNPALTGVYQDDYGRFISAFVPVLDTRGSRVDFIVGVDILAKDYEAALISIVLPVLLLTGLLLLVLVAGFWFVTRLYQRLIPVFVFLTFAMVSGNIALVFYFSEKQRVERAFLEYSYYLIHSHRDEIAQIETGGLNNLVSFFEKGNEAEEHEFQIFGQMLSRVSSVEQLFWVSPGGVPTGSPGVMLRGSRRLSPEFSEAFESASRLGLKVMSEPRMVRPTPDQWYYESVVIQPVRKPQRQTFYGFAAVRLNLTELFRAKSLTPGYTNSILTVSEIYYLKDTRELLLTPKHHRGPEPPGLKLEIISPLFVFGSAFLIKINPGPDFYRVFPAHSWVLVLFSGLLIALILALVTVGFINRRESLTRLVEERTAQLARNERNLYAFFNSIQDMLFVIDPEGRIIHVNETVTVRLGYRSDELENAPFGKIIPPEYLAELEKLQKRAREGLIFESTMPLMDKSGRQLEVDSKIIPGTWDARPVVFAVIKDITALKLSEDKFARAFYSNPSLMSLSRLETGELIDVNEAFLNTLEFKKADVIGRTTIELGIFAFPEERQAAVRKIREEGHIFEFEVNLRSRSGRNIVGSFSSEIMTINHEQCLLTVTQDITEKKRSENLLKESEEMQRTLLENLTAGVMIVDAQTHVIESINPAAADMLGHQRDEIVGNRCFQFVCTALEGECPITDLKLKVTNMERTLCNKNGHEIPVLKSVRPIVLGGREKLLELFIDITRQKMMENMRLEAESRYRAVVEALAEGVVLQTAKGEIVACNTMAEQILGLTRGQLLGHSSYDPGWQTVLENGEPFPGDQHPSRVSISTGKAVKNVIMGVKKPAQSYTTWLRINAQPIFAFDQEKPSAVVASFEDVTEMLKIQQELAHEKQRLKDIIEGTKLGTWEWNVANGEVVFNERWAEIVGYTLDELQPVSISTWELLAHPEDLKLSKELLERHFRGESDFYDCEARMKHKNGHWVWVHDRGRLISRNPSGEPLMMSGTHSDITGRKKGEEELQRALENFELVNIQLRSWNDNLEKTVHDKVEEIRFKDQILNVQSRQASMGEMIGNIAHQWRQPLNALGIIIQSYRTMYDFARIDEALIEKNEDKGMRLIHHMARTIDDFRNFFKPDKEQEAFSVTAQIDLAICIVEASFRNNDIEIVKDYRAERLVKGFPHEYGQVILVLLNNAKDVFLERAVPRRILTIRATEDGEWSTVVFQDNAGGIPSGMLEKVGTPYFTTKDSGTGIGLYMSRMIIEKNMGGKLRFDNREGGAYFEIRLPLIR